MTANVNVTKLLFKRGNTAQNAAYTGINGEITVDTQAKTLRVHDGVTTGGNIVTAGAMASYIPTDPTITSIQANVAAANAAISAIAGIDTSLLANAATQQTQIDLINANVAAANALIPNLSTVSGNIIPAANITYSLGSEQFQWRDLWVSNNTIYIGNTPVRVDGTTLLVNGAPVATTVANLVNGAYNVELDNNGDLTVPNYINFKGNTYIGDEPGSGSPAFRIVTPLGYGATIETDSDISGNSWTWTFGVDGTLGAPGDITAVNFIGDGSQLTGLPDGTAITNGTSTIDIPVAGSNIYVGVDNVGSTEFTVNGINTLNLVSLGNVSATKFTFANGVNILSAVTGTYSNTNVAAYLTTGVTTANLTITGNVVQNSAYYETYANVVNVDGNLTCNFVDGATFYATLTANVTVNFANVVATAGRATGATIIVDQGATAYSVANIQINGGGVQTVKWAGGTTNTGTASNTDIMSFSLISLDGTNWRILGQIANYA